MSAAGLRLACLLALAACGSDTAPPDAAPGEPTLAAIRDGIFNTTCALSSCHAPPTLAAKLNLRDTGLCHQMVTHASCLFGGRMLVVPGEPDASFLIDKLRGRNLFDEPDPNCATSNEPMPLGQPALSEGKIAQLEQWIRDGASCGDDVPPDAGVADAAVDSADDTLAEIATFTAIATTLQVGARTQATVTLTHGVPRAGQTLLLVPAEVAVLGVTSAIRLAPGETQATFDVLGKAPAATTTLTASTGTAGQALTFSVAGTVRDLAAIDLTSSK